MTDAGQRWTVTFSATAARGLNRLPHKIATAIVEFTTHTLPSDPYKLSKPLRYELAGWLVARRGDYRVTFRILEEENVLLIGRVEHRGSVYRSR